MLTPRLKALSVHLLTASGAVLSMLAMLAAVEGKWSLMFLWLVVALIVDGIDGPLARRFDVHKNWPTYDGVLMDLIVDYLTYVFIPAFALFKSGLLTGLDGMARDHRHRLWQRRLFRRYPHEDKGQFLCGLPRLLEHGGAGDVRAEAGRVDDPSIVILLTVAMFTNLKFIHPVRTDRWHYLNLGVVLGWTFFAGWAAWVDFDRQSWAHWGLVMTSLYLALAGIAQQIVPERAVIRRRP